MALTERLTGERAEDNRPVLLVLRALGLGDLLTVVPALRALRRAHPGHRIVVAAPAHLGGLVPFIGGIDTLLDVSGPGPVPFARPDIAVNLHGSGPQSIDALCRTRPGRLLSYAHPDVPGVAGPPWRPWTHEVRRWCALLEWYGIAADPGDLTLYGIPRDSAHALAPAGGPGRTRSREYGNPRGPEHEACGPEHELCGPEREARGPEWEACGPEHELCGREHELVSGASGGEVIIHPGAAWPARRWPASRFAAVADALRRRGWDVLITGNQAEADLAHRVARLAGLPGEQVLAGRTELAELAAVVARARLVICGDTGTAHLATAVRTPSVVLYGPVPPSLWGPPASHPHVALWPGRVGDPHGTRPDRGLLEIGVSEVVKAAHSLLGKS